MEALDSPYPLLKQLPKTVSDDSLLEGFLTYAGDLGIELYPAQEEAILELFSGRSVILNTPTGSGKSLVATALSFKALAEKKRLFYTAPIKALVSEKFFTACRDLGPENVGMMTGDASVNRDAPVICCTAEILANIALREMEDAPVDYVVMDEFHYYADRDRGWAWQVPLLTLHGARFLLMSATLGDMKRFETALAELTSEPPAVVANAERPVPLDYTYRTTPIHETIGDLLLDQKAPIYIVHFTQRAAAEQAQALTSVEVLSKDEKHAVKEAIKDARFDSPMGKDLKRWLRHGVGVHHAGLLPKYRLLVERLAQAGLLKVICGTDTLGVGVNVPIRTVLFTQLCKYDGKKTGVLSVRDFKQIAGRAGRKGFDEQGSVVCQAPEHVIYNLKLRQKAAGDEKKLRKLRTKKPPDRGYAHWDEGTFQRLIENEPERLESSFDVSHSMLLQVLDRKDGDGCRRMKSLLRASHDPPRLKYQNARLAIQMFRSLLEAEIVEIEKTDGRARTFVHSDLQTDFSLHQTLSLYIVDAVDELDEESETYAFDALSLVEAALEDPHVVLRHQLDKIKTAKVAELKAERVEYDERMRQLDELDIDKPNLEMILETFEAFVKRHPWVGNEYIRPKSIAREMCEKAMSFNEYIKEYGLSRSEGVLLRYLSNAYKAAVQSIPETAKTEALYDLTDQLGAIVKEVDSSLIDEWQRMLEPDVQKLVEAPIDEGPPDVTKDRRSFVAMIRNAMARLNRALALGRFEDAVTLVDSGAEWNEARFEEAVSAYLEDHAAIRMDATARNPKNTLIEEGPEQWTVRQVLVDEDEQNDWSILAFVDLERARAAGHPVLELQSIGPSGLL